MADEMTRAEFMQYMQAFEQRLDGRFESLERSMKVQFEDTRGDMRFSLEGLAALREATEKGFEELRTRSDEQTELLGAALTHVRTRVDRVEQRGG